MGRVTIMSSTFQVPFYTFKPNILSHEKKVKINDNFIILSNGKNKYFSKREL